MSGYNGPVWDQPVPVRSAQPVTREDDTTRQAADETANAISKALYPFVVDVGIGLDRATGAALAAVWATPPPWLIDLVRRVDGRAEYPRRSDVLAAVPVSLLVAAGIQL